jgi:hypothetical protein
MKQLSVYLDSNILISLCDGRDNSLRACVEKTIGNGTHTYPFSADQVSEITASGQLDQNEKRLSYLEHLSRCNYFVHSVTEFGFKKESPRTVHLTINEVAILPNVNKLFANFVSHDQQRRARDALGLDPNQLNNLDGLQAVEAIDAALGRIALGNPRAPNTLSELIALARPYVDASFEGHQKRQTQAVRSYEIVTLFAMLDFFGYWPDEADTYSKGSRFPDSRHAFNASYFDVLVSNDKRMKNKAHAVYSVLGIETKAVSGHEFLSAPT